MDGPAASGKSTMARAVGQQLEFWHLNSGFLYRAITWHVLEHGWDEQGEGLAAQVQALEIDLVGSADRPRVRIEGVELGPELHDPRVSGRVSSVSARAPVRMRVLELLRAAARERDIICDGRDIGTVVFPDAELKLFLTASVEERARRRLLDYDEDPTPLRLAEEARKLRARDEADSTRALAPLRKAPDAVELDTTRLTPAEVVERILTLATQRGLDMPRNSEVGRHPPVDGPVGDA